MGYLADIYVIKKTRSKKLADDFLNHFLPNRKESADEYFIPEYSDKPTYEFDNASEPSIFSVTTTNLPSKLFTSP